MNARTLAHLHSLLDSTLTELESDGNELDLPDRCLGCPDKCEDNCITCSIFTGYLQSANAF
jgi:hypothetical protein